MKAPPLNSKELLANLRAALDGKKVPGVAVLTVAEFEQYKKNSRARNARVRQTA